MFRAWRPAVAFLAAALAFGMPTLAQQHSLRLAAAADLEPVLPAILARFEEETRIRVGASYQSSASLATEIQNGAPFDLFLAADLSFPDRLAAAGLTDGRATPYARGTLVLWARKDGRLRELSLNVLSDPALKSLAVANPEHAPYGRAAEAAVEHLGLTGRLASKLVVAENIAQAAQYADSGNAEAGLISLTSALTPKLQADGHYILMPEGSYPPIIQGAVVLKRSPDAADAHRFLEFLRAPETRKIMAGHGLLPQPA